MAATMDPKAQTKYLDLKKQVNDLAWKGDFDSAAMPIVEHLISSIETISKSYRQLQDKEGRLASDLALAQAQLFPLRKENARLARENYQLHLDNVKQNEEKDSKVTEHTIEIRQLEDKISELKYLNKMKDDQMKRAELDRERLREVSLFFLSFLASPPLIIHPFYAIYIHHIKLTLCLPPTGLRVHVRQERPGYPSRDDVVQRAPTVRSEQDR